MKRRYLHLRNVGIVSVNKSSLRIEEADKIVTIEIDPLAAGYLGAKLRDFFKMHRDDLDRSFAEFRGQ